MIPSEIRQETRERWSQDDIMLLALIVKMMEIDPTFGRLEKFFISGASLMHTLRKEAQNKFQGEGMMEEKNQDGG